MGVNKKPRQTAPKCENQIEPTQNSKIT